LVLIIGDEATPMNVGFTKGLEEEMGCCWVLKKEHLRLGEVPGILRRLNQAKVENDREAGRMPHQFFLPNGSKVLVGSYVHLRKEGLNGYVEDFVGMCKEIWSVTGDTGIEVLPFVPVVYENLEKEGGLLLSGLRSWVRWLGEDTTREEIKRLSETGGREEEICEEVEVIMYKPMGAVLRSQSVESKELGMRGNRLVMVKGERRELRLRRALPAKEILRLTNGGQLRDEGEEEGEEEKRRGSFKEGVSMEAEYTFAKAVEGFCREAGQAGRYKGAYILNVKEQMRRRVLVAVEAGTKVKLLTIGASEMGRLRKEWSRRGDGKLELEEEIRVRGVLDRKEGARVEQELEKVGGTPDKILIGGPGNSLLGHGGPGRRKRMVERVVSVRRDQDGKVVSMESAYHLVEPVKLSMCERKQVAGVVRGLVRRCRVLWPMADIFYMEMFPRHANVCCSAKGHMGDLDPQVLHASRLELEADIVDELRVVGESVGMISWYGCVGEVCQPSQETIRQKGIVGPDGVHMSRKHLETLAGQILRRLTSGDVEGPMEKRRRGSY